MQTRHHAVIFEGDASAAERAALVYVKDILSIPLYRNPDLMRLTYERLTMEHARDLKAHAMGRPFGDARAFIIACESILIEAQNALLKLLEEPPERTYFVFVVPSTETLLPTVRSRMAHAGRFEGTHNEEDARRFVQASPKERIAMVEKIAKNKDRSEARMFLHALERVLHTDGIEGNAKALGEITLASNYIKDRSSSVKHLLYHIALTM